MTAVLIAIALLLTACGSTTPPGMRNCERFGGVWELDPERPMTLHCTGR